MQVAAVMQSGRLNLWRCTLSQEGRLQGSLTATAQPAGRGSVVLAAQFASPSQRESTVELLSCRDHSEQAAVARGQLWETVMFMVPCSY